LYPADSFESKSPRRPNETRRLCQVDATSALGVLAKRIVLSLVQSHRDGRLPVLDKIFRAVLAALADKTMQQRLDDQGFVPRGDARQKFLEDTKAEANIWAETISRGELAIQ